MNFGMKNLIKTASLAALLLASCSKTELPESIQDDPIFSANFTLSGSQNLTAGKDSVYLFTSFRYLPMENLREYVANFSKQNCGSSDCPGSLMFAIRSKRAGNEYFENESLTIGERKIFNANPKSDTTFILNFAATGGGDQPQFFWELDGTNLGQGNTATHEFDIQAIQFLTLTATDTDGYQTSIKTPILTDGSPHCPVPFLTANMKTQSVLLTVGVPANDVEVSWSSMGAGVFEQPIGSPDQTFQAIVNYLKIPNCIVRVAIDKLPSDATAISPSPKFSYTILTETTPQDLAQLGSSRLVFREKNGMIWKTDLATPAADDFFEILEKENYLPNENGEPTVKMKIRFSCTMKNALGESKKMVGEGTIAVAR